MRKLSEDERQHLRLKIEDTLDLLSLINHRDIEKSDELCYTEASLQQILNHLHEYEAIDDRSLV